MTANAAGSPSVTPLNAPSSAITNLPSLSLPRIPSFLENFVPSSKPAVRVASSRSAKGYTATSALESAFLRLLQAENLPTPTREHRFAPPRRWRFDFAWPEQKVAVEIQGAVWVNGRHNRGGGMTNDAEKMNAAQLGGWLVLTFVASHLKDGSAIAWTKQALGL